MQSDLGETKLFDPIRDPGHTDAAGTPPSWRISLGPSHIKLTLISRYSFFGQQHVSTSGPMLRGVYKRDGYKVVVYKNQRNTYTYKPSKASPLSSLHDKMGESSDGRTMGEIKTTIQTTAASNSTMIKNQTNDTGPWENKGKRVTSRWGSSKLLGLQKQMRWIERRPRAAF